MNQGTISLRRDHVLHTDVKHSWMLIDLVRESEPLWNNGSTFINEKLIFIGIGDRKIATASYNIVVL